MIARLKYPKDATLHIKQGQSITLGEPFYSIQKDQEVILDIAQKLGIKPRLIFQHVHVVVGSNVKPGDVLARSKKLLRTRNVIASYHGYVSRIDHEAGTISLVATSKESSEQKSFFKGTIKDIDTHAHIVDVDIGSAFSIEADAVSHDAGGPITFISETSPAHVEKEGIENHIIFSKTISGIWLSKIEALEGSGIIYALGSPPESVPYAHIKETEAQAFEDKRHSLALFSSHERRIFAYN
ncbi:hypothetical protein A3B02_00130 [Candidatus Roizmanbacteria bacterium RIFCSPLOWO2_01_FULL_42_14]|uniref:Uncharacterized protein n=4 Tax=Candidatus Roizmaniibacteriota TaxID=1752723 RepID=A0A1F7JTG1_9BACT|nr:MAG: hypothetical protein A3D08_03255 [Candidatus Roizmanbacteria bacterium RIFCSPHIGHO2_02_FULL_43_11]OGK37625.1 MAG: hypothetical protein A3F32_01945 [Candidatus Roizmanbacteria bacterium RIFCSPHIGHO2_12_FULL_42_10]OGK52052.1 MAG: hypothetical protein A3B02_00130 [Candidatus Roizmanbacteria bacterium RIFCSPLOWO2_01_FULL_42_14]OGK58904.1 MAG: hypothetical protein A3I56_04620 [Candidatus Roizmanbacteria bacterium RIFCSPLOWO2_02_FULL_43_10]